MAKNEYLPDGYWRPLPIYEPPPPMPNTIRERLEEVKRHMERKIAGELEEVMAKKKTKPKPHGRLSIRTKAFDLEVAEKVAVPIEELDFGPFVMLRDIKRNAENRDVRIRSMWMDRLSRHIVELLPDGTHNWTFVSEHEPVVPICVRMEMIGVCG